MKIRILSDLHLEGAFFGYDHQGEDILILAGDISTANHKGIFELLIENVPSHVEIYFVPGNHEYYHGVFELQNRYFEQLQGKFPNFTFLNNLGVTYKGFEFFGGTMFTDFNLDGETQSWFARNAAKDMIADFYHIETSKDYAETKLLRNWNVQDHIEQFRIFERNFKTWIANTEGKRRIVISHFMPHQVCVAERFVGSTMNPYFTCDMEKYFGLMEYWFAGHGHNSIDITINETRLIMNPRGYGIENRNNFNADLIVEIEDEIS